MEKYDYQFNFGSLDTFECNGIALREILKTNNYLLRLLKNYSQITQIQVNKQNMTGEEKEADENLRNLGLLLWNYIFSTNAENKAVEKLEKIYNDRFRQHGSDNTFVLWFKEGNRKIRFESLPWELLFWPDPKSPDEDGQFLFNLKKNRIIRQGNPSENAFQSKIPPTLPESEHLKVLLVVLGLPEVDKNQESEDETHKYEPPLPEEEREGIPLSYLMVKEELINLCTGVRSEMRILANGKAKEIHVNGNLSSEKEEKELITFSLLRDEIKAFKPHIIHIITHGRCDSETGNLELMINSNEYQLKLDWDKTLSDKLVELFDSNEWTDQNKPKLIYLEVCQSGQSTFPIKLSEKGIGTIIAMFYDIKQDISQKIAINFYKHILSEDPLEILEAFHSARQYSWGEFEKNDLGFGLPLIYYNYDWDAHLINKNHLIHDPAKKIKKELISFIEEFHNSINERSRIEEKRSVSQINIVNVKAEELKDHIRYMPRRSKDFGENVKELLIESLQELLEKNVVEKKWPKAVKVIEEYLNENPSTFQLENRSEKDFSSGQDNALTSQFKPTSFPNRSR